MKSMHLYLIHYTKNAEEIIAKGAWATRSKQPMAEISITREEIEKMISYAKRMKLSSVLDFPYFIFSIKDVSRSFTHQWVRYRIAAHMQQSLRYVQVDPRNFEWFVIPPTIVKSGTQAVISYISNQINAGKAYLRLLNSGIPAEDARFALPIGTKTHISTAMDIEEILHVIRQRTCLDAQWEIRTVANTLLLAGKIVHPLIFKDWGPYCISEKKCMGTRNWRCLQEVKDLEKRICELARKYEGKSGKLEIDLTDLLGFKAPEEIKKAVTNHFGVEIDLDYKVYLTIGEC